jgi:hypothetical protein
MYHNTNQLYYSFRQVAIKCQYKDAAGISKNCIDPDLESQNPFLTLSRDECKQLGTADATITYRACNDNPEVFTPISTKNAIRFRKEVIVEPSNWDNKIDPKKCRIYTLQDTFDLCKESTVIDIEMDGILTKPFPNYCRCYLYREANINITTNPPTVNPTINPTAKPTDKPTAKPTIKPTADLTAKPTCKHDPVEPTVEPTAEPTKYPTAEPTVEPTAEPTKYPTAEPTKYPTAEPTKYPTAEPTKYPTAEPTKYPTAEPTKYPTAEPTKYPTAEPTKYPTAEPTKYPTAEPTKYPTAEPTKYPTAEPTKYPTAEPTKYPTAEPTKYPTVEPTKYPTAEPTKYPTAEPTKYPTAEPTKYPTSEPTKYPTAEPTAEPTIDSCEIYFTELADPVDEPNAGYIEIKAACPGKLVNNIVVVTQKGNDFVQLPLNIVVPNDGFIIICVDKHTFTETFGKTCDIEDSNIFPEGKYPIALVKPLPEKEILDIYGYRDEDLPHDIIFTDGRAVRDTSYTEGSSDTFNPTLWHIIPGEGSDTASTHDVDPRVWVNPPLKLFFTEFADPVDGKAKRFIELYSPNKRNYKIVEDLAIIKFHTNSVSYDSLSLKGKTINENGFLVLCNSDWSDKCTDVITTCSLFTSPGTKKFSLAGCNHHTDEYCLTIDVYGLGADQNVHNYTDGRAVRRKNGVNPLPCNVFDIGDWFVIPGLSGIGQVNSSDTDPGEWNDTYQH